MGISLKVSSSIIILHFSITIRFNYLAIIKIFKKVLIFLCIFSKYFKLLTFLSKSRNLILI